MIENWKNEPRQISGQLRLIREPSQFQIPHKMKSLQELAALPEASRQEDSSVRQAIEEVLARVNLADTSQEEIKQHDIQPAAEQKGSRASSQPALNELSLGGSDSLKIAGTDPKASQRTASSARSVLPPR